MQVTFFSMKTIEGQLEKLHFNAMSKEVGAGGTFDIFLDSAGGHLLPTLGIFLAIVYCCFIFAAAKEKCPEIVVELKFNLCEILECSIVSYICIIHLIVIT